MPSTITRPNSGPRCRAPVVDSTLKIPLSLCCEKTFNLERLRIICCTLNSTDVHNFQGKKTTGKKNEDPKVPAKGLQASDTPSSLCRTTDSRRTVQSEGVLVQRASGRQMNLVLQCPSSCGIISVTDRHGVRNVRLFGLRLAQFPRVTPLQLWWCRQEERACLWW